MEAETNHIKRERINLRLESTVKKLIERAAGFEGKTISHFILNSAMERAQKTVQKHEVMSLNAKNSQSFLEALSKPPKFKEQLNSVLDEHAHRVISK